MNEISLATQSKPAPKGSLAWDVLRRDGEADQATYSLVATMSFCERTGMYEATMCDGKVIFTRSVDRAFGFIRQQITSSAH